MEDSFLEPYSFIFMHYLALYLFYDFIAENMFTIPLAGKEEHLAKKKAERQMTGKS